jgi:uncharacterized protein (TIGR02001 family)
MRKQLIIVGATILTLPSIVSAESALSGLDLPGEFSANVALVSEYSFRGIAQSDEGPAIQGGIDWSNDLGNGAGIYLGTWGSNIDFNDSSEASSEFDFYGGLTYGIENWSFDIGAIYYAYPNTSDSLDYDFWEIQAAIGYDFNVAALTASINYSPDNFGASGDAQYYKLAADIPLPHDFSLSTHIGRQAIEKNSVFGVPDYTDWSIGLGYTVEGFDLALQYIDTDLDKAECADGCDGRAIFSVSRSF